MPNPPEIRADVLNWLLEKDPPGARYLALRDLLDQPEGDPELAQARQAAHQSGPIAEILAHMHPQGYWEQPGPGYNPKYFSTVWSLISLAQLGARLEIDKRIQRACEYLLVLLSANWLLGLYTLLTLAFMARRIPLEEGMLLEQFGGEYRRCIERTGRWLPKL